MLTRESYSLNKPSTKMSAKKAHPTREIHHQTIGALGFCCFFSVVCVPLLCLVGVSSTTFSTINITPRVSCYFIFFVVPLEIVTWHLVSCGCVPPNRYTNRKCVNAAFFWSIIFFLQSLSFSTHTRHINATTHRQLWQPLTHSLFTHLICVLLLL